GAGFIGSHLCRRLVRAGHEVTCVDNLSTGHADNIADLLAQRKITAIWHDVTSHRLGVPDIGCDRIFALACPASPVAYRADPIGTLRTAFEGTRRALELAKRTGARLLLASTSEIYGDPAEHPQTESYWGHVDPLGPRSCYDEGKRVAEALVMAYGRQAGVAATIARIFNTYGPGMAADDGRVVPAFIGAALDGRPFPIEGDGRQTRSFCYVDDTVEGLVALMECEAALGMPVNLGNPTEISMVDLALRVAATAGVDVARFEKRPAPEQGPRRRRPDIARAKALLGWQPTTGLDDGLAATVAWFRERRAVA
ncbi:MAG: NAD-dependent epimerase/dehydratase family protein, partial [Dongiaceae bacterium]